MGEDASLEDFLDAGSDGDASAGGNSESGADVDADAASSDADAATATDDANVEDDATTDDANAADESIESATATYRVSADAETCPSCDESSRRFWRDGDRFVCNECKDW